MGVVCPQSSRDEGNILLIEAVRQLRGESTSQVDGARLAIAHGNGGMLGSRHSAGTIILEVINMAEQKKGQISRPLPKLEELGYKAFLGRNQEKAPS